MKTKIKPIAHKITTAVTGLLFIFLNIFGYYPHLSYAAPGIPAQAPLPAGLISTTPSYKPWALKGIKIYPDDPLKFDFLLEEGDAKLSEDQLKKESELLIKYFLAALTLPEEDLWVNLSPFEQDKIIPEPTSQTEMGKGLLEQDHLLKKLVSSLTYPETDLGKEFWQRVYAQAYQRFGTTKIPVNTFNKVWIVPDKAVVYEDGPRAIVEESKLKVMMEADYLAFKERGTRDEGRGTKLKEADEKNINDLSSQVMKEVVIPAIEEEVNSGANFTTLRKMYRSFILASWFKKRLKESLLGQVYVDQKKTKGIDIDEPQLKERVYQQYLQSYKDGLYNYIRTDYSPQERKHIKRKYWSGGVQFFGLSGFSGATSPLQTFRSPSSVENGWRGPEVTVAASPISPNSSLEGHGYKRRTDARPDYLSAVNSGARYALTLYIQGDGRELPTQQNFFNAFVNQNDPMPLRIIKDYISKKLTLSQAAAYLTKKYGIDDYVAKSALIYSKANNHAHSVIKDADKKIGGYGLACHPIISYVMQTLQRKVKVSTLDEKNKNIFLESYSQLPKEVVEEMVQMIDDEMKSTNSSPEGTGVTIEATVDEQTTRSMLNEIQKREIKIPHIGIPKLKRYLKGEISLIRAIGRSFSYKLPFERNEDYERDSKIFCNFLIIRVLRDFSKYFDFRKYPRQFEILADKVRADFYSDKFYHFQQNEAELENVLSSFLRENINTVKAVLKVIRFYQKNSNRNMISLAPDNLQVQKKINELPPELRKDIFIGFLFTDTGEIALLSASSPLRQKDEGAGLPIVKIDLSENTPQGKHNLQVIEEVAKLLPEGIKFTVGGYDGVELFLGDLLKKFLAGELTLKAIQTLIDPDIHDKMTTEQVSRATGIAVSSLPVISVLASDILKNNQSEVERILFHFIAVKVVLEDKKEVNTSVIKFIVRYLWVATKYKSTIENFGLGGISEEDAKAILERADRLALQLRRQDVIYPGITADDEKIFPSTVYSTADRDHIRNFLIGDISPEKVVESVKKGWFIGTYKAIDLRRAIETTLRYDLNAVIIPGLVRYLGVWRKRQLAGKTRKENISSIERGHFVELFYHYNSVQQLLLTRAKTPTAGQVKIILTDFLVTTSSPVEKGGGPGEQGEKDGSLIHDTAVSQKELEESIDARQPPLENFIKNVPTLAYLITRANLNDLPKIIREALGGVDKTRYSDLKEYVGSIVNLQMKDEKTPDFYPVGVETFKEKYREVELADVRAKNSGYLGRLKGVLGDLLESGDKNLVAILRTAPQKMVKMSEIGYSVGEEVVIAVTWGGKPATQTKPAGNDAYLTYDGKQWHMVNVDERGLPISYVAASSPMGGREEKANSLTIAPTQNVVNPLGGIALERALLDLKTQGQFSGYKFDPEKLKTISANLAGFEPKILSIKRNGN